MTIAGTNPEQGLRVVLELAGEGAQVRYVGAAYLPGARVPLTLAIDAASGETEVAPGAAEPATTLARADLAFVEQLGRQAWRNATQLAADDGGGRWPRRIQRWRGPK